MQKNKIILEILEEESQDFLGQGKKKKRKWRNVKGGTGEINLSLLCEGD